MRKLKLTDKRKQDYFYSEAIKILRTNIQFCGCSIKTILITSCYPNEGKSDVVLSLAQELGSVGKKVLLLVRLHQIHQDCSAKTFLKFFCRNLVNIMIIS